MNILYITYPLNGLLMVAMPVVLAIYLIKRFRLSWSLFGIGAATFVLSQVGHLPFNAALSGLFDRGILPMPPESMRLIFFSVLWGLSAGFWEELARFAAYRWWAKDARSWGRGLLLGTGHGGVEAILLGLLVLTNFIYLMATRNVDVTSLIPADQVTPENIALAKQQIEGYWSQPWSLTLLGAVERLFSIPFHLAASLLVMQTFTRKQMRWLWLAVAWHALADAMGPGISLGLWRDQPWGAYAIEGVIGLFALASLAIIFSLRQPEPVLAAPPELPPVEPLEIPVIEVEDDDINGSRYVK